MNTPTPTETERQSAVPCSALLSELEADLRIANIERRTSLIDRVDPKYWDDEIARLHKAIAAKRGHSDNVGDQAQNPAKPSLRSGL
jgi:hypothetical protein